MKTPALFRTVSIYISGAALEERGFSACISGHCLIYILTIGIKILKTLLCSKGSSVMLRTIRKTIEKFAMLKTGTHILAAVSGGPDSVALLRVLTILSPEYGLRLTVAHLNHGLRGVEADKEENFVRKLCAETGISCICRKVDISSLHKGQGRSLEEIAREARYKFLDEIANSFGADRIATGHHRDDQAETVLINLIRGSGSEGLKGILPVRDGRIIRPMIEVTRHEIIEFLGREELTYMIDSSNLIPVFFRNRIRNDLIPTLIANYNPRIVQGLCQTAEIMRRDDDYLQQVVRQILLKWGVVTDTEEAVLPLTAFRGLHEALQGRIIKVLMKGCSTAKTGLGYRHIEAVLDLVHSPRRFALLDLPCRISIEKAENTIRIRKGGVWKGRGGEREGEFPLHGFEFVTQVPGTVLMAESGMTVRLEFVEKPSLTEMRNRPQTAFMDYDCIDPPLILRSMKPGDRMAFMGMGGVKKLKKYFIDRKIPRALRSRIPLLVDSKSVIWIAGERISERVRVTRQTKRVLKAEMI
jgi:tRNA(Ile)-lysidine synthase